MDPANSILAAIDEQIEGCEREIESLRITLKSVNDDLQKLQSARCALLYSAPCGRKKSDRQDDILAILKVGKANALRPMKLYTLYCEKYGNNSLKIDAFRTALWRIANIYSYPSWVVFSDEGRYWKMPSKATQP